MCLYIFSPNNEIHIDYAAESVTLNNGRSETLFDLLITNHSQNALPRLHLVFPHPIPIGKKSSDGKACFSDITGTWLDPKSTLNRFYQTDETALILTPKGEGTVAVTVKIPNPNKITEKLSYNGEIREGQTLTPFTPAEGEIITDTQWKILSFLGWSIFTLKFDRPIAFNEARWLRLRGITDVLPQNSYFIVEYWARKFSGILIHNYEFTGPVDIRHRFKSALEAATTTVSRLTPAGEFSLLELLSLQAKIAEGMEAQSSKTVVRDWRLNMFDGRYRSVDVPTAWGDICPCGGLFNMVKVRPGSVEKWYQWKAGELNVIPQVHGGFFTVHVRARAIPVFVLLIPWISLLLAALAFSTRKETWDFLGRLWPW